MYHVRVRPPRETNKHNEFGDYDGQGKWFGGLVATSLASVAYENDDKTFHADFEGALSFTRTDCVGASFTSGRGGVRSTLRADGVPDYARTKAHKEMLRSGVLLELPKNRSLGRLLVHSAHGHGVKLPVESVLKRDARLAGLILELEPVVDVGVLQAAARQGLIEKVTLVKYDRRPGDGFDSLAQWGDDRSVGKIGLVIPSRRQAKLRSDPLRRFLDDPTPQTRASMLEFRGAHFDDAEITVDIPGTEGTQRTFALGEPTRGHAWSEVVEIADTTAFGGSAAAIARALENAL